MRTELDELERRAVAIRNQGLYPTLDVKVDITLQLVAIARAALAWSEARFVTHPGSTQEKEATRRLIAALQGTP
jgi:hypothetical protein